MHAPRDMICPTTCSLMEAPVLLAGDGCTYSKSAIQLHLDFCRARELPDTSGGGVWDVLDVGLWGLD